MKRLLTLIAIVIIGNSAMAQCNPTFTYQLGSGSGNNYLAVAFTNTTVFTPDSTEQVGYVFDYGDGNTGFSELHEYASAGVYNVVLTMTVYGTDSITDSMNVLVCSNTYSQQVYVSPTACATTVAATVASNNNTSTTVDFTANTPAGSSGMTYAWDFGDGTTGGSGINPSHAYTATGMYTVVLTATNGSCTFTNTIYQPVVILDCDTLTANFTSNSPYNTASFTNTSSYVNTNGLSSYVGEYSTWDFGDGTTSTDYEPLHVYATPGTYNVTLTNYWFVDSSSVGYDTCVHTVTLPVTAGGPPNRIAGNVYFPLATDSSGGIQVWLIKLDSNIISAVDSVISYNSTYLFDGKPNGVYLVKAALVVNPTAPGSVGVVPTYDSASLYWSGAANINHTGGDDENNNIYMQIDTVTSGPGFVSGDVLTGAGKGTGAGEPVVGLLIYLRNTTTNQVVGFQYTDANGNYSFSNIPLGNYDTYPEGAGYATTAYNFSITNAQTSVNNVSFRENASTMTITPITTGVGNVNAITTKINIYPNPTSGQAVVWYQVATAQAAHIVITNVLGQKVGDNVIDFNSGSGASKLDVSTLADGVYMVNIKSNNGIDYNQKLVIQH